MTAYQAGEDNVQDSKVCQGGRSCLKKPKRHQPKCLQVLSWALNEHTITEPIHEERSDLSPRRKYLLIPRSSCSVFLPHQRKPQTSFERSVAPGPYAWL